jgi:hypothetical protein
MHHCSVRIVPLLPNDHTGDLVRLRFEEKVKKINHDNVPVPWMTVVYVKMIICCCICDNNSTSQIRIQTSTVVPFVADRPGRLSTVNRCRRSSLTPHIFVFTKEHPDITLSSSVMIIITDDHHQR